MSAPPLGLERRMRTRFGFDASSWIQLKGLVHRFPAGVQLFQQGAPCEDVLFLRRGLAKLLRTQPSGQEVIVGLRGSGWLLGAAAAIQESPYVATAITLIACDVLQLGAQSFRNLVRRDLAFSWGVHRMHSSEVYAQISQLGDLGALTARQRLEQLLCDLAPLLIPATAQRTTIEVPLRQWEIAQLIAITPPYLSELLGDLEREGRVSRRNGRITVLQKSERRSSET